MAIFPTFRFRQYRPTSKSPKIDTFPKGLTHGFGPKITILPTFLFRQYRPGQCPLRYSKTKNAFLSYKKRKGSKSRKIDIFQKGLLHGFGPKMAIFPTFSLGNIGQENVFYDILARKKPFSRL